MTDIKKVFSSILKYFHTFIKNIFKDSTTNYSSDNNVRLWMDKFSTGPCIICGGPSHGVSLHDRTKWCTDCLREKAQKSYSSSSYFCQVL